MVENLLAFGRRLRQAGIDVPVGNLLTLIEALRLIDLRHRDDVFQTCRTVLIRRHDELATFAGVFDAFWRDSGNPFAEARSGSGDPHDSMPAVAAPIDAGRAEGSSLPESGPADPIAGALQTWSDTGGLEHKDFADLTPAEMAAARDAIDELAWFPGFRRTRRWIRRSGSAIDLRAAFSRSLRTAGEVLVLPTRRRRERPRSLVVLCDVSGSMDRYTRILLHFAHRLVRGGGNVEVFVFSTALTRITRPFRMQRTNDALAAVSREVHGWSGGTRIGAALEQFQKQWSRRVLRGGPVVLLLSDGWDRGDPALLRDQMARLQRSCHRLIWLNPLIGTLDYAPLTRGLQAALPYVDDFLPVRTLTDVADLARHLRTMIAGRGFSPARASGLEPRPASRPTRARQPPRARAV